MKKSSKRLTPRDWLDAALAALERGGLEAVRILPLCDEVGASRGSFYWHFADRAELLARVLKHWEVEITDAVLDRTDRAEGDAEARLHALMAEVVGQRRARFEPAVRAWALHDPAAAKVVRRVDRKRLRFLTGLFADMGFEDPEAGARARTTLAYLEGDPMIRVSESAGERKRFLELRHRLLTTP